MKTNYSQQEILLMTGTTFVSSPWCRKEDSNKDDHISEKEQLEEACWNGWLQAMLPEVISHGANGGDLYLWQIREAGSFLELELCEVPEAIDRYFSIDPYSFLAFQSCN
jgi:hypothetical protein